MTRRGPRDLEPRPPRSRVRGTAAALGVALAVLGAGPLVACRTSAPPGPSHRATPSRPRPPAEVVRRTLALTLPAPETLLRVDALPPFPKFRDPYPLPSRRLKHERNLAWKSRGAKRQLVITHLAARLWKMANANIDQVRALEARARRGGAPPPATRIATLRRQASAHLQECITLLEGVLESPQAPRMARVRLAHYLRELKPAAAIPQLQALLRDEPAGPRRGQLGLDLAQLLLGEGAPAEAAAVLDRFVKSIPSPRARLVRALALALGGAPAKARAAAIRAVLPDCQQGDAAFRRILDRQLPVLLASLRHPARALEGLRTTAPRCLARQGGALVRHLVERLLALGRPGAARRVRESLGRLGLRLPARLDHRVIREAGPFPVAAAPPTDARWAQLLGVRLQGVLRCAGRLHPGAPAGMTLRLKRDGRVRLAPRRPAPQPAPSPLPGPRAEAQPRPHSKPLPRPAAQARPAAIRPATVPGAGDAFWRCLVEAVPHWRLPPWKRDQEVALTLTLTLSGTAPRQTPPTDRD